jgi:NitT/TauT family transport system substrate-binding protein
MQARMAVTALSVNQLAIWIAQDAGIFAENGVDLDVRYIAGAQPSMGALLGGDVDFLEGGPDAAMAVAIEGGDVVVVAHLLNKIVQALYVAPAIREPADLRGRQVGVTRVGSLSDSSTQYLLRLWGLEPERDITLVQTGGFPETVAALQSGGLDAGILPPPFTVYARELGFVELANLWTQPLEYPGSVVSTHRPKGAEQEELARRILRGTVAGIHRLQVDRPLALRVLQERTQIDDPKVLAESYELNAPLFERNLRISRAALRSALDGLARTNARAAGADVERVIDPRFVDEIAESGLVERLYNQ